MKPVFDVASGRVRLDAATFEALCGAGATAGAPRSSPASDARQLKHLRECGVLVDRGVVESLLPALAAVERPIATLHLRVTGHAGHQLHQGWLSVVSAVLADLGDGAYDFAAIATEFVPTLVARMTRLGLRPHLPAGRVPVAETMLDALASPEPDQRVSAEHALVSATADTWPAWSAAAHSGHWRFWVADLTWPAPETVADPAGSDGAPEQGRRLAVLDTGAGLLRVDVDETGPALVAASPTDVWRLLSDILPADPVGVAAG